MDQRWTKMGKNGSTMIQKWIKNGSKMDQNGPKMGQK